jgi:hypothetical protein
LWAKKFGRHPGLSGWGLFGRPQQAIFIVGLFLP